jgi:hypothetical protein
MLLTDSGGVLMGEGTGERGGTTSNTPPKGKGREVDNEAMLRWKEEEGGEPKKEGMEARTERNRGKTDEGNM